MRLVRTKGIIASLGSLALVGLLEAETAWAQPATTSDPENSGSIHSMNLQEAVTYAPFHQPELRAARERFLAVAADARVPGDVLAQAAVAARANYDQADARFRAGLGRYSLNLD